MLTMSHAASKIGLVIPVYSESGSICSILSRIKTSLLKTICLIIDAPIKQEMERIRQTAIGTTLTIHIIKNRNRMGIGFSLKQGFEYLQRTGHDIVVVMAGNGKDDPEEIERLIRPLLRSECDYVQGSRYMRGGRAVRTPIVRIIFNRLYPLIWTLFTGKRCTDVTNGYRCYKLKILQDSRINLNQDWLNGYSLEYYIHYKVLSLGYPYLEVPVTKTYAFNTRGGYSKIQPLKDWWPIISPLILLFFGVRR